ncbi:response regulator transcription factor [Ktedonobacter robiniae]|uniref:Transcriptional regulatory protein YdfI n=1 Tax=Ktedonobacter robiniae TaxID=2778365 RepID=A0ABQ3UZS0_9CHLR|nr:response regulator transcription factor [Ktedonobacter robiniae]GHO57837.1 transcriptional regulatory protein YdfI [Ktedonobacter robiniae]
MNEIQDTIRIVVVDDHLVVREGLRMMLEIAGKGFTMLGDAEDGATAVRVVEELQPDVVLMDLRMPGMDGLEAITRIRERWPHIAVVILTTYNEDDLLLRGLRAGACGYLLKDTNRETLFHAIRAAARGDMLLQPEIMARILAHTTDTPNPPLSGAEGDKEGILTERECEVLQAVARGERSKEIAARLGISIRTVSSHLTSIYTKLGVDSRVSAVTVGIERGLVSPNLDK